MTAHHHAADRLNRRNSTKARQRRGGRAVMEALEDRQLMSLTVEVRAADGSSSATATSGEVLSLQILGVVTAGTAGSNDTNISAGTPSSFGINDVTGSIISTGIYSGDVAGNLAATVLGPFQANGYQAGTQQDLNSDGNIDVGSNNANAIEGYFFARHGGIDTSGTVSGSSMVINLGTLTYTVTNLKSGGETDVNFQPRPTSTTGSTNFYYAADWFDGIEYDSGGSVGQYANDDNSTFQAGTPFVIKDTALNPAPVVNTDSVTATRNVPLTINALANVTTSDALVTSSVTIVTQPTNGTATVQSGGSIQYTPDTGYTGADSLTYHVTDSNGKVSNNGTVNVSVVAPPPPVAVADTATTLRGQAVTISVLANDTDASGTITPASVLIGTAASDGTAVVQSDGTIVYTPNAGFIGTDTFTYTESDSLGDTSAPGTVTVSVTTPVPPTANNDTAADLEGHSSTISVLTNDTKGSVAIDPTTVIIGTGPANGTAVPNADGTIAYTSDPGFTGTDTFTYTVKDILADVSNTATVTVSVTPVVPPTANPDEATAVEGEALSIPVLTDDTANSVPLDTTSVNIGTAPTDGSAVPQSDGTVLYTSNYGFVGTDTFTYTVNDQYGDPSNAATVTVTVENASPPAASAVNAPVLAGVGTPINVLSSVTSSAPLVPGSVSVNVPPVNGTAIVDKTTGLITYTPSTTFVGSDSFQYTVADENGNTSEPATVNVNVGASLSSAKGGNRSITFVDASGDTDVVTLNVGAANVIFSGSGQETVKNGKVTISSGSNLEIAEIDLSGTTKASALTVRTTGKHQVTIGGITDASPLSSITAKSATLNGTISVGGLGTLTAASVDQATLTIGSGGAPRVNLSLGVVGDTTVTSSVPIGTLNVKSWISGSLVSVQANTVSNDPTTLTAPSIASIVSAGAFDVSLALTPVGKTAGVGSARITGALDGVWTDSGTVGAVTAGSVSSSWAGNITGALASMTIKSGGLASALTAGSIGALTITGDLTSTITAASARSVRVIGALNGAVLDLTGTAGLTSLTATSMTGSVIVANVTGGTTLTTATASNLGAGTIGTIVLTGRTGDQFSNNSILASKIRSVSLGAITTDNNSTPEGIVTNSIAAFSGVFGASTIHLGHAQLASDALLTAYLTQQSIDVGDFGIKIL